MQTIIKDSIYHINIKVFYKEPFDKALKWVHSYERSNNQALIECDWAKQRKAVTGKLNGSWYYLWFTNPKQEMFGETMVHEIMHLTGYILRERGIYFTDQGDEAYAYYAEYLYKQLNNFRLKANKK